MAKKTRVAILGGGCGGVSAAFWLTNTQPLRDCFEVTLFTHGWRLGGKAASGRNAADHQRIEEHGLHLYLGFYQNAFQTLKACYDELPASWVNEFRSVDQAFEPLRTVILTEQVNNVWEKWRFDFPQKEGEPWDSAPVPPLGWDALEVILQWLRRQTLGFQAANPAMAAPQMLAATPTSTPSASRIDGVLNPLDAAIALVSEPDPFILDTAKLRGELNTLQQGLKSSEQFFLGGSGGREFVTLLNVGAALALGLTRDVLIHGEAGFDLINNYDLREWLQDRGGLDPNYGWSAPVRSIYDLAFSYINGAYGSPDKAKIAAGAAAKTLLRTAVQYRDAPFWRMKAGMGDVVFAPLYEVLSSQRKVAIKFFHRVKNIRLSADKHSIKEILFSRQVDLKNGNYSPLRDVRNLKCWPSTPDWDQIKKGDQIKTDAWNLESIYCDYSVEDVPMLCDGSDDAFDVVVLAIPPESLAIMGMELLDKDNCPKILKMRDGTNSVPTQSVQLWRLMRTGVPVNPGDQLIGACAEPFNTVADMSHLTPREDWGAQTVTCEYYCGPMEKRSDLVPHKGQTHQQAMDAVVAQEFTQWNQTPGLPQSSHIPQGKMISQFNHANFDPSELYVQTLPGTVDSRLGPGDSGLDNLYFAGDWTRTSINGGSAEAAFESGRKAAALIEQKYCVASKPKT